MANIGFLGGTGEQGRGLAHRFAHAGHRVLIGSRSAHRAKEAADALAHLLPAHAEVWAGDNLDVATRSDVVLVVVPWSGHAELLASVAEALAGKIVVDCVNPLGFDGKGAYSIDVAEGSAAEQAAALLPSSRVVAAFHHVSAALLLDPAVESLDTDVLVLGDDREATEAVQRLAADIPGVRGLYAGRLRNARQVEALTANLISINRRYKAHSSIRITDVTAEST